MTGTEYTLTGFDDFLERRRVVFVEPLPSTRVCNVCGVVPCSSLLLPCGHVVCHFCKGQIAKGDHECPLDNTEFSDAEVAVMTFKQSDLEQRHVLCVAGGQKCSFDGKLSELKDHLIECGSDEVRCVKCQQSLLRSLAIEHCQQCSAHTASGERVSAAAIAGIAEELSDIRKDLKYQRNRLDWEEGDLDTYSLARRLGGLERQLVEAQEENSAEQCHSLLSVLEKAAFTPGPHRSPSKPGNFIATCRFPDFVNPKEGLKTSEGSRVASSDMCTLAGYTFKLTYKFDFSGYYKTTVEFFFCLCEGDWDICVKWPFSKEVSLIVTHPSSAAEDIRLPVSMQSSSMKKPSLCEHVHAFGATRDVNWDDIDSNGFVIHKSLYVNVEME